MWHLVDLNNDLNNSLTEFSINCAYRLWENQTGPLYKQFYVILKVFFIVFRFFCCLFSVLIRVSLPFLLILIPEASINSPTTHSLSQTWLDSSGKSESSGTTTSSCPKLPRPHTMRFLICDHNHNWQLFSSTLATKQGIRLSRL